MTMNENEHKLTIELNLRLQHPDNEPDTAVANEVERGNNSLKAIKVACGEFFDKDSEGGRWSDEQLAFWGKLHQIIIDRLPKDEKDYYMSPDVDVFVGDAERIALMTEARALAAVVRARRFALTPEKL